MFGLNPLAISFYPRNHQSNQNVKTTPFEASLNAYSFFGVHGARDGHEQGLEAVEEVEETFVSEEEVMKQRKKQEEERRIALWNRKYAKKYQGEQRLEKVNLVMTMVPAISRPILLQPVAVIQPVIFIIPVQIINVYFLY